METGLEVSLDEARTLQVDSGTVVQSGEEYSIDATEVTVPESDEEPRKDVVYINSEQEVVIATGGDESKQPSDAERFDTARPSPPSLKDVEEAVSLAVIWIEPEETDLVEDDLQDRRVKVDLRSQVEIEKSVWMNDAHALYPDDNDNSEIYREVLENHEKLVLSHVQFNERGGGNEEENVWIDIYDEETEEVLTEVKLNERKNIEVESDSGATILIRFSNDLGTDVDASYLFRGGVKSAN